MTRRLGLFGLWFLLTLIAPLRYLWWGVLALVGHPRAWKMTVAEDQAWNVPWGGSEDETISSRAAKAQARGRRWGCLLCRWLDRLDPGHCARNLELDEGEG